MRQYAMRNITQPVGALAYIQLFVLSRVIGRGMAKSGRIYAVTLDLIDKPGQLLGGVAKLSQSREGM